MKLVNIILSFIFLLNINYHSYAFIETSFNCYVDKVIDGDTIYAVCDLNNDNSLDTKIKIRLASIDTFESQVNRRAIIQSKEYNLPLQNVIAKGQIAKQKLKELLPEKSKFSCYVYGKDHYGRFICRVINYQSIDVSEYLVCNGYANPFMVRFIHQIRFQECLQNSSNIHQP